MRRGDAEPRGHGGYMHISVDLAMTPRSHARAWAVLIICICRLTPLPECSSANATLLRSISPLDPGDYAVMIGSAAYGMQVK